MRVLHNVFIHQCFLLVGFVFGSFLNSLQKRKVLIKSILPVLSIVLYNRTHDAHIFALKYLLDIDAAFLELLIVLQKIKFFITQ